MSMHIEVNVGWECDNCGELEHTEHGSVIPKREDVHKHVDGWIYRFNEMLCKECAERYDES